MTSTAAEQLKKVQKVSAGIRTLFQIATALWGLGLLVLGAIALAPSIDLKVGNGDFKANSNFVSAQSPDQKGQLLVHLGEQKRHWGVYLNVSNDAPQSSSQVLAQFTPLQRGTIIVVSFLNWLVMLILLQQLAKLFENYAKGEIFTLTVVNRLRKVGFALLGFPAISLLNSTVATILVSKFAPALGWFDVSVNFDMLLAALIVILISWIMDVGRLLREENELTV